MSKGRGLLRSSLSSPSSSIFPPFFFLFLSVLFFSSIFLAVGQTPSSSPTPPSSGDDAVRASVSTPGSRKSPPPKTRAASSSTSPTSPPSRKRNTSSIMAALREAPQYSGLVALIAKANLTVSLDTTSPLTVFGPTNDAMESLQLSDTKFLTDPKNVELLRRFVFYHFVNRKLLAANLTTGSEFPTLEGESVIIETINGTTLVQYIDITVEDDIIREDGVVHAIKEVLMPASLLGVLPPPGEEGEEAVGDPPPAYESDQSPSSSSDMQDYAPASDMQDYAPASDNAMTADYTGPPEDESFLTPSSSSSPSYSGELVAALKAHPNYSLIGRLLDSAGPGTLSALDSLENDTLFAPSNQGMSSSFQMAQLLTNDTARNDVLFFHLLSGRYNFSWLNEHPGVYDKDTGFEVIVTGGGTEVYVGNPAALGQIVTPNLYENPKVVVHGINKVLLPREYAEEVTSGDSDNDLIMMSSEAATVPPSLPADSAVGGGGGGSVDSPPGGTGTPASGSTVDDYPVDDEGSSGAPGSSSSSSISSSSSSSISISSSSSSSSIFVDESLSPPDSPSSVSMSSSSSMQMTAATPDAPLESTIYDTADDAGATAVFISALARNSDYTQIAFLVGQVGPTYLGDLTNNTLFAPSNEAIGNFMASNSALLTDNAKLDEVLKFHVLNGSYTSSVLKSNPGDYGGNFSVVVEEEDGSLSVGYSSALGSVIAPDLYASTKIVIHGVNRVLLPPKYANGIAESDDLVGSVAASPASVSSSSLPAEDDYSVDSSSASSYMEMTTSASDGGGALSSASTAVFITALARNSNYSQIAFLVTQFGPKYFGELTNNTLFAPNNDAIKNFMSRNAALLTDKAKLDEVLKFHVLNGSFSSSFLKSNPGDYGGNFSVVVQGNVLRVGFSSARGLVVAPDLYASAKVTIHGVDRVLLPPKYASESVDSDIPGSAAAPSAPGSATTAGGSSSPPGSNLQSGSTNGPASPFLVSPARIAESSLNAGLSSGISLRSLGVLLAGLTIDFLLFFLK